MQQPGRTQDEVRGEPPSAFRQSGVVLGFSFPYPRATVIGL